MVKHNHPAAIAAIGYNLVSKINKKKKFHHALPLSPAAQHQITRSITSKKIPKIYLKSHTPIHLPNTPAPEVFMESTTKIFGPMGTWLTYTWPDNGYPASRMPAYNFHINTIDAAITDADDLGVKKLLVREWHYFRKRQFQLGRDRGSCEHIAILEGTPAARDKVKQAVDMARRSYPAEYLQRDVVDEEMFWMLSEEEIFGMESEVEEEEEVVVLSEAKAPPPPKKKRGRPPGSRNKSKIVPQPPTGPVVNAAPAPFKRGVGRPRLDGQPNASDRKRAAAEEAQKPPTGPVASSSHPMAPTSTEPAPPKRKRGRPSTKPPKPASPAPEPASGLSSLSEVPMDRKDSKLA